MALHRAARPTSRRYRALALVESIGAAASNAPAWLLLQRGEPWRVGRRHGVRASRSARRRHRDDVSRRDDDNELGSVEARQLALSLPLWLSLIHISEPTRLLSISY